MTRREYWRLTFEESRFGAWRCRARMWFCGLRGHQWDAWTYEVPYEEGLGDGCRTCQRCDAYEMDYWRDRLGATA